jgi:hypothetical protein
MIFMLWIWILKLGILALAFGRNNHTNPFGALGISAAAGL